MKSYSKQISFIERRFGTLADGSGTLIKDHGLRVATFLNEFCAQQKIMGAKRKQLVCAALFHDLLEDTKTTEEEIIALSDKKTLELVREMTISFDKRTIKQAVAPMYKASEECMLIKMADIYDNTKKSSFVIRNNGIQWYETFFMPLLSEYKKLMRHRVKNAQKYKKELSTLEELVCNEIETLTRNLTASKLLHSK